MRSTDAVVIGSGPNGLVAANLLAEAGWDVLVLEAQAKIGGAVHSDASLRDGYVHDTCSSFYPLAAASPTIRRLRLENHGLKWEHAPAVLGTPFSNGSWAMLHRTPEETAAALDALTPGDGDAWLAMCNTWQAIGEDVIATLLTPFPPVRSGLSALTHLRRAGGLSFVRTLLAPARAVAADNFRGDGARMLIAGNAAHADIGMDSPGSGMIGWLLSMLGQSVGYPVPRGGASALAQAMARRFEELGGTIIRSTRVEGVVVKNGRAVGVRTEHDGVIDVRKAVVADVSAPSLYGGLVGWDDLPGRTQTRMKRFSWDPATFKVDWALSGPIPWTNAPSKPPGTVHLGESVDELSDWGTQIAAGAVPARPFLLIGQMAAADPSRAPAGAESAWAYTHVPQEARSDAGDEGIRGRWDAADSERMADRMQRRIEEYAPGFGGRILDRRILSPKDLQAGNENLVNGALNGGTSSLRQQLVFRPVLGLGRAETPVRGLYLGSAAAHPGGGVHGACGANAARAALAHERFRRMWPASRTVS